MLKTYRLFRAYFPCPEEILKTLGENAEVAFVFLSFLWYRLHLCHTQGHLNFSVQKVGIVLKTLDVLYTDGQSPMELWVRPSDWASSAGHKAAAGRCGAPPRRPAQVGRAA